MSTSPPTCLLCESRRAQVLDELSVEELSRLWAMDGTPLSEQTIGILRQSDPVQLFRCHECGLEYFDARLAGNGRFYEEIVSTNYYPGKRPEFISAIDWARERQLRQVLDVGCGAGGFLDLAKAAGCKTYGVEMAEASRRQCKEKGHIIFEHLVEGLSLEQKGGIFDLVTLFHVVEHLPDPKLVLRSVSELCAPEGFVFVAVPFADGICRLAPWIPQQWPPHHLSRWGAQQLARLGESCGLKLVRQTVDPIRGSELRHFVFEQQRRSVELGRPVSRTLSRMLCAVSYIATTLARAGFPVRFGTNITTIFQRSSSS